MNRTRNFFAICLLLLLGSTGAYAQGPLGKMAKTGVGALKGTVKSAANLMVGSPEEIAASQKKGEGNTNNNRPNGNGEGNQPDDDDDHGGGRKWSCPHTVQIDFDNFCWECVSPSYDGVFCMKVGSSNRYRFYKTDGGDRISRVDWRAEGEPHFNKGVCAVKSASSSRWFILKLSGDSIALDPKIKRVSNFMDGVAVAATSYTDYFFINTKGQPAYPNVKPSELEIYPLIDGTRRMFKGNGGYGYIDANGTVVIKPQFSEAHNFSSGLAIVYDMMATGEKYWVINTMGKKVSEVPARYASYGWTHSCWMSDFINSAAVAKNSETGKYDIIRPDMSAIASFDYASPFCLKTMPSTAAVCVVRNEDWEHPQFCDPAGNVLTAYNNPGVVLKRPTQPWIDTQNDKGEKTVRMPNILLSELTMPAKMAWVVPSWEYTGYSVFTGSLTNDVGYVMDYEGIIRKYSWKYEKPESYSADGYAKAIMKSTKSWRKQVSTWIEELEDHMVFIDVNGNVVVEIVDKPKE